jgi:Protein of unknown function (DUF1153)
MGQYNLPAPKDQRWVARRKAEVLEAIRNGGLSNEDACALYNLTSDELLSWQVAYNRHGLEGLKAMKVQAYRRHTSHTGLFP